MEGLAYLHGCAKHQKVDNIGFCRDSGCNGKNVSAFPTMKSLDK